MAKNISLRGNLDSLANISPQLAGVLENLIFNGSCDKKSILVTRNQFLSQEIISCELISFG